ncbi:unnamed protein product [Boreogadus saida]
MNNLSVNIRKPAFPSRQQHKVDPLSVRLQGRRGIQHSRGESREMERVTEMMEMRKMVKEIVQETTDMIQMGKEMKETV